MIERASRFSRCAAAILALLAAAAATAAGPATPLESFGAKDGLRAETINTLLIDRAGILWIGSREGLIAYDGYSFTPYLHDVTDPASLVDNWVRTIFEDARGVLWVGTNTGGLCRLDRTSGRFDTYRHRAADSTSLSHDSVYAIADAPGGKLLVGTQFGLNLFDPANGLARRVPLLPPSNPRSGAEYVLSIVRDPEGAFWIATVGDGVLRFDLASGTSAPLPVRREDPRALPSSDAFVLGLDADGSLWIGTRYGFAVRRRDGAIDREAPAPGEKPLVGQSVVTIVGSGPAGEMWVGTFTGVYRARNGSHRLEVPEGAGFEALGRQPVTALAVDRSGSMWIGTTGSGLFRLRRPPAPFVTIGSGGVGLSTLSFDDVTAVLEDREGRVWVGTFGGGVDRLDPGAGKFVNVPLRAGSSKAANGVLHLNEDHEGRIWVACSAGLVRYDPRSGRTNAFVHDAADPTSLGRGYVTAVLVDRDGRVWVGTGGGGLHRLRPDERGFDRFPMKPGDPSTPGDDYVTVLHEDRQGRLWDGTRSGGLNLIDRATGRATRITVDPTDPEALAHHYVTCILEDRAGRLWVGTGGGGLARLVDLDPARGARFVRVTARDGLVDDTVMGLAEDDDGSLWVSTRQGLARFDPRRNTFVGYDTADGLPSSEGNLSAAARTARGIFIGTLNGLVEIPRGTPFPTSPPATLAVTSVHTPHTSSASARPGSPPSLVEIAYGEVLTVEFSVVDFDPHRRHRYAYRFADDDRGWMDLGSRRMLTFTDLSAGTHELELRGRGARGGWSDPPTRIALRVVPPFYMTDWFRFVVATALAAAAIVWHATRTARLQRRNRELTELQTQREAALEEAQAKEKELQAAFDHLRQLTRRLEAAKEEERRHIARELHDEMGQLLTAAKMNVQLLQRGGFDERAATRLADTVELLDRMIRLVRELSFDLRPPLMDDLGLLAALRGQLEALAQRSGMQVGLASETLPDRLPPEVEIAAFRIVQEAVTNVVRHAGARRVDVVLRGAEERLEIEVRDDGRGFDAGETAGHPGGGDHLGLQGMRERAQALGGNVTVETAPGRGTALRATLSWRG